MLRLCASQRTGSGAGAALRCGAQVRRRKAWPCVPSALIVNTCPLGCSPAPGSNAHAAPWSFAHRWPAHRPRPRRLPLPQDELLSLQLLLPSAPWTRATHRHLPPPFRAAVRTLLLGAATHSNTTAAAAASLEAGAGTGPSDKGPASAAPDSGIGGGGGGSCLLQRLPRDVVEVVAGHAARPWHAWASAPAEQVLAFPTLEYNFD